MPEHVTTSSLVDLLARPLALVGDDDPILRAGVRELSDAELISPELGALVGRLWAVLDAIPHGMGLAAPQLGWPISLFVANDGTHRLALANARRLGLPELVRVSLPEGCLSLPGFEARVARPVSLSVSGRLPGNGDAVRIRADDTLARIFDHELDHLAGRLYIDRMLPGTFGPVLAQPPGVPDRHRRRRA